MYSHALPRIYPLYEQQVGAAVHVLSVENVT